MPSRALTRRTPAALATEDNPVLLYMGRLTEGSHVGQAWALLYAARTIGSPSYERRDVPLLGWHRLRYADLVLLRARLQKRCDDNKLAPATANRIMAAVRGVLREAATLGRYPEEELQRIGRIEQIEGERPMRGRAVSQAELRDLFAACLPGTVLGARDATIVALLYGAGLRRAEVCKLDLADVNILGHTIKVKGKRGKERIVPLPEGAARACKAWLAIRGYKSGPFVVAGTSDRRVSPMRLHPDGLNRVVERLAERAGIELTPHDLTRSYVFDLLDSGVDLATVQALAGRSNGKTTAKYDRRGEYSRTRAAAKLTVPFAP